MPEPMLPVPEQESLSHPEQPAAAFLTHEIQNPDPHDIP